MSIIDKFFNGGSARKNVPFGYDKRIVMPKSAQDTILCYVTESRKKPINVISVCLTHFRSK